MMTLILKEDEFFSESQITLKTMAEAAKAVGAQGRGESHFLTIICCKLASELDKFQSESAFMVYSGGLYHERRHPHHPSQRLPQNDTER